MFPKSFGVYTNMLYQQDIIPYNMKYWRRFILAISSEKHIGEFYFGDLIPGSLGYWYLPLALDHTQSLLSLLPSSRCTVLVASASLSIASFTVLLTRSTSLLDSLVTTEGKPELSSGLALVRYRYIAMIPSARGWWRNVLFVNGKCWRILYWRWL